MTTLKRLPPFPLTALISGKVGVEHEVHGQIAQLDESNFHFPGPLTGLDLALKLWYLLPDGDNWLFPIRSWTQDNYNAGYDKLVVGNSQQLMQGHTVATTKLDAANAFVFKWKEVVRTDRNPYVRVHHITESDIDPNDRTGYKLITVKSVYRVEGVLHVTTPNQIPDWIVNFTPIVLLEFFASETQKQLPPLTASCFPVISG